MKLRVCSLSRKSKSQIPSAVVTPYNVYWYKWLQLFDIITLYFICIWGGGQWVIFLQRFNFLSDKTVVTSSTYRWWWWRRWIPKIKRWHTHYPYFNKMQCLIIRIWALFIHPVNYYKNCSLFTSSLELLSLSSPEFYNSFLPPAYEICGKVMFSVIFVHLFTEVTT